MNNLFSVLASIVFGITEPSFMSGSGHMLLIKHFSGTNYTNGNYAIYISIAIGFLISVILMLNHDFTSIIKAFFNFISGIFINISCLFNHSKKKRKLLASGYSRYAVGLFISYIFSIPTAIFLLNGTKELVKIIFITGLCFILTAFFASIYIFAENGKKLPKDLSLIFCAVIGAISGICVLPGISGICICFTAFILLGYECKFAYKYSLLLNLPVSIIVLINSNSVANPYFKVNLLCIIILILTFIFSCISIRLFFNFMKSKLFFIIPLYIFIIGTVLGLL